MHVRIPALLVAVTAIAVFNGCGNSTGIRAEYPNRDTTLVVYALNNTPVTVPTAILLRTLLPVRIDATFSFDVAFDIDAAGQVLAHSPRAVGGELVSVRHVGMRTSDDPYASITIAPTGGYRYDTTFTMPVGKVILVDSYDPSCSAYSYLGQNIRAKMVLDSANTTTRAIYLRILSNPNCGFRQLTTGIPRE